MYKTGTWVLICQIRKNLAYIISILNFSYEFYAFNIYFDKDLVSEEDFLIVIRKNIFFVD